MADTFVIRALPSFQSLGLFPLSILSFCPNCWSRLWVSQDLMWPFTPRLLKNAPEASSMMCAMHGMRYLNAGHSIPEASSVYCISSVIELFDEAFSVVIPSNWPSVSSKRSCASFKCMASLALVWLPLIFHHWLVFKIRKEYAINLIKASCTSNNAQFRSVEYAMTYIMASFSMDVHLSRAKLTLFRNGNCFPIAPTDSACSLWQMLREVVEEGSSRSLCNTLYDCHSSRFDIALHGIWAKPNPKMR